MLNIATKNKPDFVCIVPEKRKELTTEGGLNILKSKKILKKIISKLKKNKIPIKNIVINKALLRYLLRFYFYQHFF